MARNGTNYGNSSYRSNNGGSPRNSAWGLARAALRREWALAERMLEPLNQGLTCSSWMAGAAPGALHGRAVSGFFPVRARRKVAAIVAMGALLAA